MDAALAEVEQDSALGTTMIWGLCDSDIRLQLRGMALGNAFLVRKTNVEAISPNRNPENGDTLTDKAGKVYAITSANGTFDQAITGGFASNSSRNTDIIPFIRLIYGDPEQQ